MSKKEIVLVRNLDDEKYEEEFREEFITIPPRSTIVMPRRKAVRFLASYPPNNKDGSMRRKMLVIERTSNSRLADIPQPKEFVSHYDGKIFGTQAALDKHLENFQDRVVKSKVEKRFCPFCDSAFEDVDLMMEHIKQHKEEMTGKQNVQKKDAKTTETPKKKR